MKVIHQYAQKALIIRLHSPTTYTPSWVQQTNWDYDSWGFYKCGDSADQISMCFFIACIIWQLAECMALGDHTIKAAATLFGQDFQSQMPKLLCLGSERHNVWHGFGLMCHKWLHFISPSSESWSLKKKKTESWKAQACVSQLRKNAEDQLWVVRNIEWAGVWNSIIKLNWWSNFYSKLFCFLSLFMYQ